ncbi:Dynamin-binding protein [Chionoecetes opilio]|uniref:Dynamin-binding protein n=1 Tax=Chionoecetes opilio TaxID=41210 RepID=A0A8J4YUI0_CHIOP|nr:Dynamin-binding protein [Chionoecetes opilio]
MVPKLQWKLRSGPQGAKRESGAYLDLPVPRQVHEVVDKHWVRGQGGGSVGLVPSSVLVGLELPPHPPHLPLFVAAAEFLPSQPEDLALARGDFVVGLNAINDAWWQGETWGRQGMFPLNFVWSLNKDILKVEDTSEQQVRLLGRVRSSIKAQLPEELDLYTGDLVTITHVVDKGWYRSVTSTTSLTTNVLVFVTLHCITI